MKSTTSQARKAALTGCFILAAFFCNKSSAQTATAIKEISDKGHNAYYTSNKAPLKPQYFVKLPVTAIKPGGWLRRQLELQRGGLTGNLGEISVWLSKTDNAWVNKSGKANMAGRNCLTG
ncbi:hypothetical protein [Mucilaginibacter ginsenosidivorans]|uniref:hypothetical protein n=1 Tax=Mucilaginibacter ginsenosidivorans TaxID=398053 RepID=UPI001E61561E|nr:hypothetical protein [Mucilaginibacter ginsenosidivorans]